MDFSFDEFRNINNKKNKILPRIINPSFLQYVKYTDDVYWKQVFQAAAEGKFPSGFYYRNGIFGYHHYDKDEFPQISPDPKIATGELIYIFKKYGKLKSNNEIMAEKDFLNHRKENREIIHVPANSWRSLKGKKNKELSLERFVLRYCDQNQLNLGQKKELIAIINMGIYIECFGNDEIIVKNDEILEIKGLIYNQREKRFDIDIKLLDKLEKKNHDNYTKKNHDNYEKKNFNDLSTIPLESKYLHFPSFELQWKKFLVDPRKTVMFDSEISSHISDDVKSDILTNSTFTSNNRKT